MKIGDYVYIESDDKRLNKETVEVQLVAQTEFYYDYRIVSNGKLGRKKKKYFTPKRARYDIKKLIEVLDEISLHYGLNDEYLEEFIENDFDTYELELDKCIDIGTKVYSMPSYESIIREKLKYQDEFELYAFEYKVVGSTKDFYKLEDANGNVFRRLKTKVFIDLDSCFTEYFYNINLKFIAKHGYSIREVLLMKEEILDNHPEDFI